MVNYTREVHELYASITYRNGIPSMEKFDDQFQEPGAHGSLPSIRPSHLKYVSEQGCYVTQGLGRCHRTLG